MNTRYTLILVLIACFAGMSTVASATNYTTVSTGEYAWDTPDAWMNGIIPPNDIGPNDVVDINCEVVLMTSLGNRGLINVYGVLTIYGGGTAKSLTNRGIVDVIKDGTVRILRNKNASSSPNLLKNLMGSVRLNGVLEIVGGHLVNMSNIDVTYDGVIYNYGHQNGSNQVITQSGRVINLDTYLGSLSGSGRMVETDVTDQNWACLPGNLDNIEGTINFQGGSYAESECEGGYTGPMLPITDCGEIQNIYAEGNLKNGLDLFWAPVNEAKRYVVGIQTIKGGFSNIVKVVDNRISIPSSMLTGMWNVKYTISAICDDRAANAVSQEAAVESLERNGTTSIWDGASADMYPNPVSEVLYIQPQMDVINTTVDIYDPAGRLVMSKQVADGIDRINIDMSDVPVGTYIVKLDNGENQIQQLVVVAE